MGPSTLKSGPLHQIRLKLGGSILVWILWMVNDGLWWKAEYWMLPLSQAEDKGKIHPDVTQHSSVIYSIVYTSCDFVTVLYTDSNSVR